MTKYINKGGKAYRLGMEKPELKINSDALQNMRAIAAWKKHVMLSLTDGIEISPELLREWPEWGIKGEGEFAWNLKQGTTPPVFIAVPTYEPESSLTSKPTAVPKQEQGSFLGW